jgi:hypothetical protein
MRARLRPFVKPEDPLDDVAEPGRNRHCADAAAERLIVERVHFELRFERRTERIEGAFENDRAPRAIRLQDDKSGVDREAFDGQDVGRIGTVLGGEFVACQVGAVGRCERRKRLRGGCRRRAGPQHDGHRNAVAHVGRAGRMRIVRCAAPASANFDSGGV